MTPLARLLLCPDLCHDDLDPKTREAIEAVRAAHPGIAAEADAAGRPPDLIEYQFRGPGISLDIQTRGGLDRAVELANSVRLPGRIEAVFDASARRDPEETAHYVFPEYPTITPAHCVGRYDYDLDKYLPGSGKTPDAIPETLTISAESPLLPAVLGRLACDVRVNGVPHRAVLIPVTLDEEGVPRTTPAHQRCLNCITAITDSVRGKFPALLIGGRHYLCVILPKD